MSSGEKNKDKPRVPNGGAQFSNVTAQQLEGESDDEENEEEVGEDMSGKPKSKIVKKKAGGLGRRRIDIKFIENKSRRQVTFSRRKRGLMKKAYELTTLTGTQALVLIASETGHVYTFATPKLQPVVTLREGKELIQSCLNAPDNNNYPPSDFIANSSGGNGSAEDAGQAGGKAAGESPPSSPAQQQAPPMQPPQGQAPSPHHAAEAYAAAMYGAHPGMHPGALYGHPGIPGHYPPPYPHELYGGLPPMALGHHPMNPHHNMGK